MDITKFIDSLIARFIGTKHERDIKKLRPVIASINAREAELRSLSDENLKTRFAELPSAELAANKGAAEQETDAQHCFVISRRGRRPGLIVGAHSLFLVRGKLAGPIQH